MRKYLKFVALCLFAGLALWWFARGMNWAEAAAAMRRADWPLVALAAVIICATCLIRAFRWKTLLRPLAPFVLIPLGTAYCQIHEIFFEDVRSTLWRSLVWAFVTLMPWVVATIIYERRIAPGEARAQVLRRALLLAICALTSLFIFQAILGGIITAVAVTSANMSTA